MKPRWIAGGVALAAVLGIGAWQGAAWLHVDRAEARAAAAPSPTPTATVADETTAGVVTISTPKDIDAEQGATPMADRVAVLGVLNKRNGESRDVTLKPGQAVRVGDAVIRLRACDTTAPWEPQQLTGAFVQLDVQQFDKSWRRVFSGWLYKEQPALNVVQNPIYDVWPKSCKMSRPETGPDTESASAVGIFAASSAKKSPASADNAAEAAPTDDAVEATAAPAAANPAAAASPSAAPSNTR
jgi:hypothetical protein